MDPKARQSGSVSRRKFMQLAGLSAGAAGAMATGAAAPTAAKETAPGAGGAKGYRETEHVKTYYALARA